MWVSGEILPLDATEAESTVFIFLLGLQCKFGSLPNHDPSLAMMCRRWPSFAKVWPKIRHLFPPNSSGRLQNPWMASETSSIDTERVAEADRKRAARADKRAMSGGRPEMSPGTSAESGVQERRGDESTGQERKKSASRGSATPPIPDSLPREINTPEVVAALAEYQESRREQGHKPLKPQGLKAMYGKLARWGPAAAVAALHDSISNGYQGVFLPKGYVQDGTPEKRTLSFAEQTMANADIAFAAMNRQKREAQEALNGKEPHAQIPERFPKP